MIIDFLRENADVIQKIWGDIIGVSKYAYAGIAIATVYVAVYLLYMIGCKIFKRKRKLGTDHAIAMSLMFIYMTSLLYIVFMSREVGEFSGVNMKLWSTWGSTVTRRSFFIENILLFIPMGILMPSAFTKFRKVHICILSCFVFSLFIEGIQYFFGLGFAELDDVVTNTIGGAIGIFIWKILWLIHVINVKVKEFFRKNKS